VSITAAHVRDHSTAMLCSVQKCNWLCCNVALRGGKRYTGKAFYVTAAIEITCHDHSMPLRSAR